MKRPKLCDEHGYSYEWINGQKPHLIKHGIRTQCKTENFEPIVVHLQLLQARQPQRPRLQVRKLIIQITIHQSSQVKVWIDKLGETRSVRYTSLTTTISHDNNNHRTSKELAHGSPPCLGRGVGGSQSKPTVHPCPLRWGDCGLPTNFTTHNSESKKTQQDNNMAEQVWRDLSVRRASVCSWSVQTFLM